MIVGFTMFAFDEDYEDPNDRYWLWRLMIDEGSQRKGYGTAALQEIIRYFTDHGANNIRVSTKAGRIYEEDRNGRIHGIKVFKLR